MQNINLYLCSVKLCKVTLT